MRKALLSISTFLPLALAAQRLEVIASGGQYLARGGISITATIGEVFVAAPYGREHFVTEGFQQGYLLPGATVLRNEYIETVPDATLFPNPAVDRVQVSLKSAGKEPVRLLLYNSVGRLMEEAKTESNVHNFFVATLPAGHYWLVVQAGQNSSAIALPFEKINH